MEADKKAKLAFGGIVAAGLVFLTGYVGKSKRLAGFRQRTRTRARRYYGGARRFAGRTRRRFGGLRRRFSYRRRSR